MEQKFLRCRLGGTASANGMNLTWGSYILPALIGAINKKGGSVLTSSYVSFGPGSRYNLGAIEGAPKTERDRH